MSSGFENGQRVPIYQDADLVADETVMDIAVRGLAAVNAWVSSSDRPQVPRCTQRKRALVVAWVTNPDVYNNYTARSWSKRHGFNHQGFSRSVKSFVNKFGVTNSRMKPSKFVRIGGQGIRVRKYAACTYIRHCSPLLRAWLEQRVERVPESIGDLPFDVWCAQVGRVRRAYGVTEAEAVEGLGLRVLPERDSRRVR